MPVAERAGRHVRAGDETFIATEFTAFGVGATLLGKKLYASRQLSMGLHRRMVAGDRLSLLHHQDFAESVTRSGHLGRDKADTLSISAFQIGMYGWMALVFLK